MLTDNRGFTVSQVTNKFSGDIRARKAFEKEAVCWECGCPLVARRGAIKRHHWAHKSGTGIGCSRTNESPWHRGVKESLIEVGFEVERAFDQWRFDAFMDLGDDSPPIVVEIVNSWSDRYLDKNDWLVAHGWHKNAVWVFNHQTRNYDMAQFAKVLLTQGSTVLDVDGDEVKTFETRAPHYQQLQSEHAIAVPIVAHLNELTIEEALELQSIRIFDQKRHFTLLEKKEREKKEAAKRAEEVREREAQVQAERQRLIAEERQRQEAKRDLEREERERLRAETLKKAEEERAATTKRLQIEEAKRRAEWELQEAERKERTNLLLGLLQEDCTKEICARLNRLNSLRTKAAGRH